jgi:hypothetical protein
MKVVDYRFDLRDYVLTIDPARAASVTVSVPHDTLNQIDCAIDLPARKAGVVVRDLAVAVIAADIAAQAEIHLVRGMMWRGYLDYNRTAVLGSAYDDLSMERYWREYRGAIMSRVTGRGGRGRPLLIDLHGFVHQPSYGEYDIILGTGNRSTVASDVDLRLGEYLSKCGYRVFVPAETEVIPGVPDRLSGQDTVRSVFRETGVDSVQLEVARRYRARDGLKEGRQLARDLASFITEHVALDA